MHADDASETKPNPDSDSKSVTERYIYATLVVAIAYGVYDLTQQDYSSRYAFGFTAIGIWAFVITALLLGHLCRPSTRYSIIQSLVLLLAYLGSYALFTVGGGYYFSPSGQARYSSGLSISDVSIWHPRFLYWEPFKNIQGESTSRGSTLGYYYSPLIAIDRYSFHPTQQFFADNEASVTSAK